MIYLSVECMSGIIKFSISMSSSTAVEKWYFNFWMCYNWKNIYQIFIIMFNFKWFSNRLSDIAFIVLYTFFFNELNSKFHSKISDISNISSFSSGSFALLEIVRLGCVVLRFISLCIVDDSKCFWIARSMDRIKWIHHHR